jgi:hypothetical protein
MKKLTAITTALALTLLVSGFAFAMQGMDHGNMKAKDMSVHDGMQVVEKNLNMMKADVETMKDPAQRQEAMSAMNKHMTDMHHGMAAMEGHAKKNHDTEMEASMKQMNKEMMITMKGMGMMKKDPDAAIKMMEEGNMKMEKTLMTIKSGM